MMHSMPCWASVVCDHEPFFPFWTQNENLFTLRIVQLTQKTSVVADTGERIHQDACTGFFHSLFVALFVHGHRGKRPFLECQTKQQQQQAAVAQEQVGAGFAVLGEAGAGGEAGEAGEAGAAVTYRLR
jgi:hypothetical protein